MKHLTEYKLFESYYTYIVNQGMSKIFPGVEDEINDILAYLKDDGFKIVIKLGVNYSPEVPIFSVYVHKGSLGLRNTTNHFKLSEVKNEIINLKNNLSDRFNVLRCRAFPHNSLTYNTSSFNDGGYGYFNHFINCKGSTIVDFVEIEFITK